MKFWGNTEESQMLYNPNSTLSSSLRKTKRHPLRAKDPISTLRDSSLDSPAVANHSGASPLRSFRLRDHQHKHKFSQPILPSPRSQTFDLNTADQICNTTHIAFIAAPNAQSSTSSNFKLKLPIHNEIAKAATNPNSFTPFLTLLQSNQSWYQFAKKNTTEESCPRDIMRNQLTFNKTQKNFLVDNASKEQTKQVDSALEIYRQYEIKFNLPKIRIKTHQDILAAQQEAQSVQQQVMAQQQSGNSNVQQNNEDEDDPFSTQSKENNERKLTNIKLYWYCISDQSWRPETREFPTLNYLNGKLYFYGGMGNEMYNHFTVLDFATWKWKVLEEAASLPEGRYGHTAHWYKKDFLIFGGEKKYNSHLKMRSCFNDIQIYNFAQNTWSQVRTFGDAIESRRSHASVIINKFLFIYGGINVYNKHLNDILTVNLESLKSTILQVEGIADQRGIAFHGMSAIYRGEVKIDNPTMSIELKKGKEKKLRKVKEEGVYVFGGIYQNSEASGQLRVLKIGQKPLKWIIPETKGVPPIARYQHCQHYFEESNVLIIYGGRNDSPRLQRNRYLSSPNGILSDVAILDLENLNWIQVEVHGIPNLMKCAFTSCLIDTRLIVFGGYEDNGYANLGDFYCLELDQNKTRQIIKETTNPLNKDTNHPLLIGQQKDFITVADVISNYHDLFDFAAEGRIKKKNNNTNAINSITNPNSKNPDDLNSLVEVVEEETMQFTGMRSFQPMPKHTSFLRNRKTVKSQVLTGISSHQSSKFKLNENGIPSLNNVSDSDDDHDDTKQKKETLQLTKKKKQSYSLHASKS